MQNQHRQLAAILFTDIVGYTALMQENEQKAVALIKHYNAALNEIVDLHNGKVLNYYGDGSLCTFHSVTEALNCTIELQKELQDEPTVPLRIGLHVGEVFFENEKALGDGVNVASRIQSLGQANTILFSKEIFDKIRNQPELKSVSLGLFEFKNVGEPMEVFALANEGLNIPKREEMSGKLKEIISKGKTAERKKWLVAGSVLLLLVVAAIFIYTHFSKPPGLSGKEKSIAVLPFKNESLDKEKNDPFCNGMTLAVLKNLTWMNELQPIAAQSVERYRDTKMSIPDIAKELGGIKYIVQGSVQRNENEVKISASLVNAETGQQIWADDFPGQMENIFSLQEDIAQKIAAALKVKISPEEKNQIGRVATKNTKALDVYYEAQMTYIKYAFTTNHDDTDYWKIQSLCDRVLALDSNMADAYVLKTKAYLAKYSDLNKKEAQNKSFTDTLAFLCQKAVSLDNHSADVFVMLSRYYSLTGNKERRYEYLQKALDINPNHPEATRELCRYYVFQGNDSENAIRYGKKALMLDPQSIWASSVYLNLFMIYMTLCDFEMSERYAQKAIYQDINPADKSTALEYMGHLNMVLGRGDEVLKYANENLKYDSNALYSIAEAYCYLKNDCSKAVLLYERLWKIFPEHLYQHRYAIALWKTGKKAEAMRLMDSSLAQLRKLASLGRRSFDHYDMAGVLAFMGNKESAYKILRRPPEDNNVWGFGFPYQIQTDPLFDNLRNDKEFKDLVQKVIDEKTKLREKIKKMEASGEL